MIKEALTAVSQTINVGLTLMYWNIGKRIRQDIIENKRAEYGASIVSAVSAQLTPEPVRRFKALAQQHLYRLVLKKLRNQVQPLVDKAQAVENHCFQRLAIGHDLVWTLRFITRINHLADADLPAHPGHKSQMIKCFA